MSNFFKDLFGAKDEPMDPGIEPPQESMAREVTPSFQALAVLDARGVTPEERDRVAKAQRLLESLPHDTPTETKRAIVEAALEAFGVSVEDIVAAAAHEIDVMTAYIREGETRLDELRASSAERIAEHEQQIDAIRKEVEVAEQQQAGLATTAREVIDRVEPVRGFFVRVRMPQAAPEPELLDDADDAPADLVHPTA